MTWPHVLSRSSEGSASGSPTGRHEVGRSGSKSPSRSGRTGPGGAEAKPLTEVLVDTLSSSWSGIWHTGGNSACHACLRRSTCRRVCMCIGCVCLCAYTHARHTCRRPARPVQMRASALCVYTNVYLYVYTYICTHISIHALTHPYLSIYLSVCLSVCLSIDLSIHVSIFSSIDRSIDRSIYTCTYMYVYISIYTYRYRCIDR